jgi:hypothetical protein
MVRKGLAALLLAVVVSGAHGQTSVTAGESSSPVRTAVDQAARPKSVQGGLVDLRYGQVSIDTGGTSVVLDLAESSRLTFDGAPISAEELLKRVPQGLSAVAVYDGDYGTVSTLDTFGLGQSIPNAQISLLPWKGPAYGAGETVTVLVSAAEAQRLGSRPLSLTIPGATHNQPFVPAQRGGLKASVKVLPGWNLMEVPVYVNAGSKVHKGRRLSFSTSPPEITGFGPHQASGKLATIPGWVDSRSPSRLLDPTTASLTVSAGARVVDFQPRVDRTVFSIEADGPGEYWLEFSIADRMGRKVSQRWPLTVQP